MSIIITCDYCSKDLEFGGDWKRVEEGRVACSVCQEILFARRHLDNLQINLTLQAATLEKLNYDSTTVRHALLLCKTLTIAIRDMSLFGYGF